MSFAKILEAGLPQSANDVVAEEVEFVCKDFIPLAKNAYNLMTGAGGSGKSFVGLHHAVWFAMNGKRAFIWSTEDQAGVTKRRIEKILFQMKKLNKDRAMQVMSLIDIWGNDKVYRFVKTKGGTAESSVDDTEQLFSLLSKYDFALLDPLKAFHSVDENKNHEMDAVVRDIFQVGASIAKCTLLVIHHTSKGSSEDRMASRGASTITDSARFGLEVSPITELETINGKKMNVKVEGFEHILTVMPRKDNHNGARFFDGNYQFEIFPNENDPFAPVAEVIEYKMDMPYIGDNNIELENTTDMVTVSIADHNSEFNPEGFVKKDIKWSEITNVMKGGYAYAPASFINGHRSRENYLLDTNIAFLDIDDGMTLDEATFLFNDLKCAIVTTRSHQKEKVTKSGVKKPAIDRFRVAIKLDSPINLPSGEYQIAMQAIFDLFGSVDRSTKDPSRFFFSSHDDAFTWFSEGSEELNWRELYNQSKIKREIEEYTRSQREMIFEASEEKITEALNKINPDCPYDDWVHIGMALKDYYGDSGFDYWNSWSSRGSSYLEREMISKWNSFKGSGRTIGTIFHIAKGF